MFARQIRCPGPNHRAADRSLILKPSKKSAIGYVFKSFAGDSFESCADHIRERLGLPAFTAGEKHKPNRNIRRAADILATPEPDNSSPALEIWERSIDLRGTPAEVYLRDDRGLHLPSRRADTIEYWFEPPGETDPKRKTWHKRKIPHPVQDSWHHVLRFAKKCRFDGAYYPAMIALYRDIETDEPRAIHRTLLTREGHKIGRAMLGPVKGCAIKLDWNTFGGERIPATLAIGEGIESALAGRIFGYRPAWALGSAGAIAAFPVIPGISELIIFGENDASGANLNACIECKARWRDSAHVIRIRPDDGCSDLNDAWISLPRKTLDDRAAAFTGICNQFWPGATRITPREGPSVLGEIRRIGFKASGVLGE